MSDYHTMAWSRASRQLGVMGVALCPPPRPHMGSRGKAHQNQHPLNWNEIKHEGLKSNSNIMHMLLQQHNQ